MQGSNPTIYAVVLGIMRSLVEMHVSGAVKHPTKKVYRNSQLWRFSNTMPEVQKLSAVTFLRLLSLLSALPDLDLDAPHQQPAPLAACPSRKYGLLVEGGMLW
jgi:hypothetical protein